MHPRFSSTATATRAFVVLLSCFVGCSSEPDPWNRAAVEGEVSLDGEALSTGVITFFPIDGTKGPAAGGDIVDGRYSIKAANGPAAGTNRIEIRSVQSTGRMVPTPEAPLADVATKEGMLVEEFVDVIPQRYNSQSSLKHQIEPQTVNRIVFTLLTTEETQKEP